MTDQPDARPGQQYVEAVAARLRAVDGSWWRDAAWLHFESHGDPGQPLGAAAPVSVITDVIEQCVLLGLIPDQPPQPEDLTDEEAAETARWLTDMADHPRFRALGHTALLGSEGNIVFAHAQAVRRHGAAQQANLNAARDLLIRHARRRASEEPS